MPVSKIDIWIDALLWVGEYRIDLSATLVLIAWIYMTITASLVAYRLIRWYHG